MKRYKEYKDSGVEWIGEIPKEWEKGKVAHYYDVQLGKMLQSEKKNNEDTLEKYLSAGNIVKNCLKLDPIKKMWFSPSEKKMYLLEVGDLLVVEGGDVGGSVIFNGEVENCYIQNALHRVKEKGCAMNAFLSYWLTFLKYIGYIDLLCNKTTIAHFTKQKFLNIVFCIPPMYLQEKIGLYIRLKTSAIDTLITDKQKLINLLQEKRQAMISEAVTKGLDKNAKMKDSEIEWIGEIPEEWDIQKTKYLFKIVNGATPSSSDKTYWGGNIMWITPADYRTGDIYILTAKRTITEQGLNACGTSLIPAGSVVISNRAPIGTVAISLKELCTNQGCKSLVKKTDISEKYIYYYFSNMSSVLNMLGRGTTFLELSSSELGNVILPLPPIEIQDSIVSFLDSKIMNIDTLIADIQLQIEKLKQYRQSLISEVVTGKVAV